METVFEQYIEVFFIVGEKRDWIPYSSRSGTFASVFQTIMKSAYRLENNDRSSMLNSIYVSSGGATEIARISAKDPSIHNALPLRLKFYRYRRLPLLTGPKSEIKALEDWLKEVERIGALVGTWTEARNICVNAIRSYKCVSENEVGYVGFPVKVSTVPLQSSSLSQPSPNIRINRSLWQIRSN